MASFHYQPIFELGPDETPYRRLGTDGVSTVTMNGHEMLTVDAEVLRSVARQAFDDVSHLLRPAHLAQLRSILDDPEASGNDKFVALELLRNANIAAGRVLPGCQDTGTAIVMGHKGEQVLTFGDDSVALSRGIYDAYNERNLRYSQLAPLDMYTETNTGSNLPAQIEIYAEPGDEYELLFIAKGGGSANKSFLYQETKALLNPTSMLRFVEERLKTIGTSACPPYHLGLVIGGTSAEFTLKTLKLATTKYLDRLPTSGNEYGRAFRDVDMERQVFEIARQIGVGAQFGGKYFAHDVRVIRLPAPRRLVSGRPRRLLLGRSAGDREDHARRHLPRTARGEPGDVPAGCDRRGTPRRRRSDRPEPADAGDSGRVDPVPRRHPSVADGADGGGA